MYSKEFTTFVPYGFTFTLICVKAELSMKNSTDVAWKCKKYILIFKSYTVRANMCNKSTGQFFVCVIPAYAKLLDDSTALCLYLA